MRASVCRATCRRRASVCNGGHIFWLCCGPRLRGKIFPNQLIQVTAVIFKGEPWRSAHEESWGNNVLYNIIPRIRSHIWSALPGSCRRVTLPANVCSWQREEEWEFCLQYKSETWPQPKLTEQRNPESSPKKWLCHHAGADAVLFLIWINFLYRSALVLIDFTAQLKITAPIATGSLLPVVARAAGMQEALLPPCAAGMSTCGRTALGRAAALLLPTPSSSAYHPFPSWFFYTLHLFRFFFFFFKWKWVFTHLFKAILPSGLYCTSSPAALPRASFWMFKLLMAVGDDVWSKYNARVAKTSKGWR